MNPHILAIDVETGGLQPGRQALLSIAAVPTWDQEPFYQLVVPCPGLEVEEEAVKINGYSDKRWAEGGAVTLDVALGKLVDWLFERPMEIRKVQPLAHNAGFDRAWLAWGQQYSGIEVKALREHRWRCSMAAMQFCQDAGLLPEGKCSLDALCKLAGIDRPAVHHALADAAACLAGYGWLLKVAAMPHATGIEQPGGN
jgi:DNA polymerase III epsilon subunit-like protein